MADSPNSAPTPDDFDEWYATMSGSPAKDELVQRHLGLPPELLSSSLLNHAAVEDVTRLLLLGSGQVLLDLACGRGGYGLEVARRCGADLVGVDFSPVAIELARENAERQGLRADFRVGAMESTGLEDGSVDALLCVDAIQLCTTPPAAYAEMRRVLRPGGRLVLTTWEMLDREDTRIPARLRGVDVRTGLVAAGFDDVEVHGRPEWLAQERALWEEAASLDPGTDEALADLREEGLSVLTWIDGSVRVIGTAVAPG